jgi:hypothetical protein
MVSRLTRKGDERTRSVFDERLEPGQGLIPLLGDEIEVFLDFFKRLRIELE